MTLSREQLNVLITLRENRISMLRSYIAEQRRALWVAEHSLLDAKDELAKMETTDA